MMGHDTFSTTQGNSEGSVAPLASRPATKSPWAKVVPKVAAITLGGLGLAAIGALSMAQTGNPSGAATSASTASASAAFANVLAPTEWLAPGGPASVSVATTPRQDGATHTTSPPRADGNADHAGGDAPERSPPCPPSNTAPSNTATSNAASPAPAGPTPTAPSEPAAAGRLPDGRVILNAASASDLTTLPGIGQKRAEAILALRTKLKGFRKLSDLLRVKGIGVKSLRKLEPKLVLDPPSGPS